MKQTFKYLNNNRKKCVLGIGNFLDNNVRIVAPCEVATFELDVTEEDVIFIKTWKHEDKILVSTAKKSVWEVQGAGDDGSSGKSVDGSDGFSRRGPF